MVKGVAVLLGNDITVILMNFARREHTENCLNLI
jgi:hypothetical protein